MTTLPTVPIWLQGGPSHPEVTTYEEVFNPSSGEPIARVPLCGPAVCDAVIASASQAFEPWASTPVVDRARIFFRFHRLVENHFEDLAKLITREHGKSLAESRAEIQRGLEMIEFACGIPSLIMGTTLPNIARDVDAETVRHPLGVCVGITPYNFPSMVPLWMFPVAIVCGNAFILKPSEKVPLSANRLAELLSEAGLPPGVFNVLHGGRETVEHLLTHRHVAAISFVGSTSIARYIYATGTAHGKRVQAAGGAKNHLIVMPDADLDLTVKAVSASAFGCTGQRCMAGSVAVTVGKIAEPLVSTLVKHASALTVGATDQGDAIDIGPVIRREHQQRIEAYLVSAEAEGAAIELDGRQVASQGFLIGPSLVDRVAESMKVYREEIFGPVLSVVRVDDFEEALDLGRRCPYGNGAAIFTNNGFVAQKFKQHFNAGMLGINVGVPAPMAWFPFSGWNQSFFGDLHLQGLEGLQFFTRQKTTLTRWPRSTDSPLDPIWGAKTR